MIRIEAGEVIQEGLPLFFLFHSMILLLGLEKKEMNFCANAFAIAHATSFQSFELQGELANPVVGSAPANCLMLDNRAL
jgi:hypothetical protein